MDSPIINKVAQKNIVSIDLEKWLPKPEQIAYLDLKEFLWKEMILKEKEFRDQIESTNWEVYRSKYVVVKISNGAIIPQWAYLVLANKLEEVQATAMTEQPNLKEAILMRIIDSKSLSEYEGQRVLIKGCGNESLSQAPYMRLTQRLTPIVRAFSFGEACSMVPIFKN